MSETVNFRRGPAAAEDASRPLGFGLKPGVIEDLRSLAVEIVDAVRGHTIEFSNQPGVHQYDYERVERLLVERIGARVKGRPRKEHELNEQEKARFSELVGWAERRATVVLRSGTTAILVGARPHGKAKVWYNAGHHTVPWDVIIGLADPRR